MEFENWRVSMAKYLYNLSVYWIIEIFSILHSAHIVPETISRLYFYQLLY